jgi:hypothetical protein
MLRLIPLITTVIFTGSGAPLVRAAEPTKHAFLATGSETFIVDENGKVTRKYPHASRDGWVLDNGNLLLALSTSKTYPGGIGIPTSFGLGAM